MSRLALAGMVLVLLLGSSVITSCTLFRKDTDVTIAQVPPQVRKAIEKETAGWHHQINRENRIWRQSYL